MSGVLKNLYAFVNLAMAGFVLSAVAVRFIFPAVSAEGGAFWVVRTSPVSMKAFLWSKFWTGLVPVLILAECLTIVSNHFLGVAPFLKIVTATAVFFMTFALVGLAAGMGARYPRFNAENMTQVAGSYGGIAFMVAAVLFTLLEILLVSWPSSVYLWYGYRRSHVPARLWLPMALAFGTAITASVVVFWTSMKQGVQALEEMG
jgi:ABC-2 type transport system permease protein